MCDIGFELQDDDEVQFDGALARSLELACRLTGTAPTYDVLTGPLNSAYTAR